jgi:peptidoglycan hydrolase-like protein with peptidoglycan-binding domain
MTTLQQIIDQRLYISYGDLGSSQLATDKELCEEIQKCLAVNKYYNYTIDGIFGRITQTALREFKEVKGLTGGDELGPVTAQFLLREPKFPPGNLLPPWFGAGRDNLVKAVIKEGRKHGLTLQTQIAYVMATVQHEVAGTYRPIKEIGGQNRPYAPYYGRGYVQLTHKYNYKKYKDILGIDLVSYPDKALDRQVALFILCHGMANGTYTGRKLGQYVNVNKTDFVGARWVVNDRDKRHLIAGYANQWVSRLNNFSFAPESLSIEAELAPEAAASLSEAENIEFIDENTPMSEEERLVFESIMSS